MNISIIGHGNVGGALAKRFAEVGHQLFIGVREANEKSDQLGKLDNISVHSIEEAVAKSEVVVVATPGAVTVQLAKQLHDKLAGKTVIDTTNTIGKGPDPYANGVEAFRKESNAEAVVKCFNTTGFENMLDPVYDGEGIDMFVAGDSAEGKEIATQLSKEIGFGEVYDFGGDAQVTALEKFAFGWINLAIMQKQGRNMAFKILKR